jgi:hypothetical protein
VHFDQHGNRSPFLSIEWLRRDWIAERRFRNRFRLPNEQATNLIRRLRLGPAGAKRRGCLGGRHVQFLQEVRDEFAADAWVLPLRVSWALQVIINAFDARRPVNRRWLVTCQTLMTNGLAVKATSKEGKAGGWSLKPAKRMREGGDGGATSNGGSASTKASYCPHSSPSDWLSGAPRTVMSATGSAT